VSESLLNNFELKSHQVFFHSGATEAINSFVKGLADKNKVHFFYFESDHPCVTAQASWLEKHGHQATAFKINGDGSFNLEEVVSSIKKSNTTNLLNFTWVHNETGVVWPISLASQIKKETGCLVHVDAVQSVAKVKDFLQLDNEPDIYTYSSHKFGGLKGSGFSFLKKGFEFSPLIEGGGQQNSLRAGTENPMGALCTQLALEEVINDYNPEESQKVKEQIESFLQDLLGDKLLLLVKKV
jgi:cysteine desulfurase